MIAIWSLALCGSIWVLAWHLGTQAAIAGALVITLVMVGLLAIYLILSRFQDRPGSSAR